MCFVVFAVIFVKGDLSPLLGRIRYLGSNQCFNKGGVSQLLGHIRYIGSNKGLWGLKSTWVTFDFTSYIEVSILAREWSNFGILGTRHDNEAEFYYRGGFNFGSRMVKCFHFPTI